MKYLVIEDKVCFYQLPADEFVGDKEDIVAWCPTAMKALRVCSALETARDNER
jgi:hypothetical protein